MTSLSNKFNYFQLIMLLQANLGADLGIIPDWFNLQTKEIT